MNANSFEQVKSIVHKHEPDVDVIDKHASKAIQVEATLEGLVVQIVRLRLRRRFKVWMD